MARIRTVKPEFWTSEDVSECSVAARLLFIGLWNFCDDGGRMPFSPRTIKMRIFPGDDVATDAVSRMLEELAVNRLIAIYEVEGKKYFEIAGWDEDQKIDRPTYQYPDRNGVIPDRHVKKVAAAAWRAMRTAAA
jgi:hypothetical protein